MELAVSFRPLAPPTAFNYLDVTPPPPLNSFFQDLSRWRFTRLNSQRLNGGALTSGFPLRALKEEENVSKIF